MGPGGQDHRTNEMLKPTPSSKFELKILEWERENCQHYHEPCHIHRTSYRLPDHRMEQKISTKSPHTSIHQPQTEKPQVPILYVTYQHLWQIIGNVTHQLQTHFQSNNYYFVNSNPSADHFQYHAQTIHVLDERSGNETNEM